MSHLPTLGGASGPPINFPTAVLSHLHLDSSRNQRILSRGKIVVGNAVDQTSVSPIAIVYQGPNLEVLCPRTGERLAAWTFKGDDDRKGLKRDEYDVTTRTTEITCTAEMALAVSRPSAASSQGCDDDASYISSTATQRFNVRRLVVAGLSTGLICILDIKSCRLIRVIRMPFRVTSVTVLSNGSIGSSDDDLGAATPATNRTLAEELLFFQGVIAVGTQEGHLYLVDAALDMTDAEESEKSPSDLHFLSVKRSKKNDNLAALRANLHRRGERICISLNDEAYSGAKRIFQYSSNCTGETTYFPEDGVVVSHLQYVPQLAGLLVGFNFGSWQMWSTSRLVIEFASAYEGSEPTAGKSGALSLPVTGFAFTEPENDPRNFCYVWVTRGENDFDTLQEKRESLKTMATLSLYALSYKNRDDGGDLYGTLYTGLTSCNLRFDHTVIGDPQMESDFKSTGSTCLACNTLGSASGPIIPNGPSEVDRSNESDPDCFLSKIGITIFLWEVQFSSRSNPTEKLTRYYMGIFDLNNWYQAQMPIQVVLEPRTQCSYFSFCSLDEVLNQEEDTTQQLIHVWIDTSTLSRYYQAPISSITPAASSLGHVAAVRPEQHFFPSSLAFDIVCLLDQSFIHASHLGLQRKVLLELQSQGRSGLVDPSDLYQLCRISGLIVTSASTTDLSYDVGDNESGSSEVEEPQPRVEEKRGALLTVGLEHNLINLLTGCVHHWSDGKYSEAGCTLKFILDWAWKSVYTIKQTVDKATIPLFDCSGVELSDGTRRSLMQRSQQLQHLCTLIKRSYDIVSTYRWRPLESSFLDDELNLKLHLANLISTYLDVILWFLNAGLLPEQSEPGMSLFPADHLRQVYTTKRNRMQKQLLQWNNNDCLGVDMFKEASFLLIDGLCNDLGDQFKRNMEREGGAGDYPSPTLRALLLSYLIHNESGDNNDKINTVSNLIHKHRIIQYLFLDLASCLTNSDGNDGNAPIVESLIKFPSAFGIPPSIIKLTQAFWLVDHEDFEAAISMLLDPLVRASDISESQHRSILLAFLVQDRPKLALKYSQIRQPPHKDMTDIQLHISVLLANGMVHEAFQFLRRHCGSLLKDSERNKQILLYYFFNRCDTLGKLDTILQLPLLIAEEKILVDFLLNSEEYKINRKETLLLYYLQRARYSEAIALNDQLERRNGNGGTRRAIMDRYAHLLPKLSGNEIGSLQSRWPSSTSGTYSQPIATLMATAVKTQSIQPPMFHSSTVLKRLNTESPRNAASNDFTPFRPKHKRRIWETEETESQSQDDSVASRSKRSRLDVGGTPVPTPRLKELTNRHLLSVLSTPVIERHTTSILGKSQTSFLPVNASELSTTPHSILKVKGALGANKPPPGSPLSMLFAATRKRLEGGNAESEEEGDDNWLLKSSTFSRRTSSVSRESTPGRSLRFNVPKKLPPPELISPEESSHESSPVKQPEQEPPKPSPKLSVSNEIILDSDEDDEIVVNTTNLESRQAQPEEEEDVVVDTPEESDDEEFESMEASSFSKTENTLAETSFDKSEQTLDSGGSEGENSCQEMETSFDRSEPEPEKTKSNVTVYGLQETLPLDVDFVIQLANRDSQESLKQDAEDTKAANTTVWSTHSNDKASNVTMYGHDETMAINVSLVRRLAENDSKEEKTYISNTTLSATKMCNVSSDVTIYGRDTTMVPDLSLVKLLAEQDAVEILQADDSLVLSEKESEVSFDDPGQEMPDEDLARKLADRDKKVLSQSKELALAEIVPEKSKVTVGAQSRLPGSYDGQLKEPTKMEIAVESEKPKETYEMGSSRFLLSPSQETKQPAFLPVLPAANISVMDSGLETSDYSIYKSEETVKMDFDLAKKLAEKDRVVGTPRPSRTNLSSLEPLVEEEEESSGVTLVIASTVGQSPALATPGINKKKRFSETVPSSSFLQSIMEEREEINLQIIGGHEKRFRNITNQSLLEPLGRMERTRSISASEPSATERRERSSMSIADIQMASSSVQESITDVKSMMYLEDNDACKLDVIEQGTTSKRGRKAASVSNPSPLVNTPRRRTRSTLSETESEPLKITSSVRRGKKASSSSQEVTASQEATTPCLIPKFTVDDSLDVTYQIDKCEGQNESDLHPPVNISSLVTPILDSRGRRTRASASLTQSTSQGKDPRRKTRSSVSEADVEPASDRNTSFGWKIEMSSKSNFETPLKNSALEVDFEKVEIENKQKTLEPPVVIETQLDVEPMEEDNFSLKIKDSPIRASEVVVCEEKISSKIEKHPHQGSSLKNDETNESLTPSKVESVMSRLSSEMVNKSADIEDIYFTPEKGRVTVDQPYEVDQAESILETVEAPAAKNETIPEQNDQDTPVQPNELKQEKSIGKSETIQSTVDDLDQVPSIENQPGEAEQNISSTIQVEAKMMHSTTGNVETTPTKEESLMPSSSSNKKENNKSRSSKGMADSLLVASEESSKLATAQIPRSSTRKSRTSSSSSVHKSSEVLQETAQLPKPAITTPEKNPEEKADDSKITKSSSTRPKRVSKTSEVDADSQKDVPIESTKPDYKLKTPTQLSLVQKVERSLRSSRSSHSETESDAQTVKTPERRSTRTLSLKESETKTQSSSPMPKTPARRGKSSVPPTPLSPIPEVEKPSKTKKEELEMEGQTGNDTPSRRTRRTSSATPVVRSQSDLPKRTRRTSKSEENVKSELKPPLPDQVLKLTTPSLTPSRTRRGSSHSDVTPVSIRRTRSTPQNVIEEDVAPSTSASTKQITVPEVTKKTTRSSSIAQVEIENENLDVGGSTPVPELPKGAESRKSGRGKRKTMIDPFSPVVMEELEDIPKPEPNPEPNPAKKKKKYVSSKTVKSHKINR